MERRPLRAADVFVFDGRGLRCAHRGNQRGGITVFAPSGYCTNIAFGGPDHRTAFITLSGYRDLFAAPWPRPGLPLRF
jgi:hypothetical protein